MHRKYFIFGRMAMFGLLLVTAAATSVAVGTQTPTGESIDADLPIVAQNDR